MQYEVVERDKISELPPRLSRPSPPPSSGYCSGYCGGSTVAYRCESIQHPLPPSPPLPLTNAQKKLPILRRTHRANADQVAGGGIVFFSILFSKKGWKRKSKEYITKNQFCLNYLYFPIYYFIPLN